MIRIRGVILLCLLVALRAGTVQAGPIPASPSPVPSAGESLLVSDNTPGSTLNIDWEVIPTAGTAFWPGLYAYLYQVENTTASGVDIFSVSLPSDASLNSIVAAGVIAGGTAAGPLPNDNLDVATAFHPAHDASVFPILATEQDPFPLQNLTNVLTTVNPADDTVNWSFSPLAAGSQSTTLYFLSTQPPIYGDAQGARSHPALAMDDLARECPASTRADAGAGFGGAARTGALGLLGARCLKK